MSEQVKHEKAIVIGAWINTKAKRASVTLIAVSPNNIQAGALTGQSRMNVASTTVGAAKPLRAIRAVTPEVALAAGISVEELSTDAKNPTIFTAPIPSEKIWGFPATVVVNESVVPNPANPNQAAKNNPTTGQVQTSNGQPIYRETELWPLDEAPEHTLLVSDQQKERQAAQP